MRLRFCNTAVDPDICKPLIAAMWESFKWKQCFTTIYFLLVFVRLTSKSRWTEIEEVGMVSESTVLSKSQFVDRAKQRVDQQGSRRNTITCHSDRNQ